MDRVEYERRLAADLLSTTHQSMWDMLRRSASRHPRRAAVSMGPATWTYEELFRRSLVAAGQLQRLGVTRGSRVAFFFHACPEWAALHYALMRLGAVAVPVSLAFEAAEIGHVLRTADPELVIAIDAFRGVDYAAKLRAVDPGLVDGETNVAAMPGLRRLVVLPLDDSERVDPTTEAAEMVFGSSAGEHAEPTLSPRGVATCSDAAYIVFTSGSTAHPKPALCAHRSFLGAATGFVHALRMTEEDRFLAMLPTFHTGGVTCVLTAPHLSGGCVDLMGAFTPAGALRTLEERRSTVTVGFDTMYSKILAAPEFATADISSLKKSGFGATPAYIERLDEVWNFEIVAPLYGSTECGALGAIVPDWATDRAKRFSTNGIPLPGVELEIRDPDTGERCPPGVAGEICFRGWGRFLEYVDLAAETAESIDEDEFFHSGDYGHVDEDGWLYFQGRYKMMIKTGGENVAEREVEVFLEEHLPQVEFAQVVGVPDPVWGEAVTAFVQLSEPVSSETLRASASGKIARYKIPKHFFALAGDEFPVLANGRPDKAALREMAVQRVARLETDGSPRL